MELTGFLFILAGLLAIAFPFVTGVAIEVFFGSVIFLSGAVHLIVVFRKKAIENRTGHFLIAVIFLLSGLLILILPLAGIAVFTLLLAISFVLQGVTQLYFVLSRKVH